MPYLTSDDLKLHITEINLNQIINNDTSIIDAAILLAEEEAKSYLVQKYDIEKELIKTGTNRDIQFKSKLIDIALYHIHLRIAPQSIPRLRVENYIGRPEDRTILSNGVVYPTYSALGWLQAIADGLLTPKLERITPKQGYRNRFGGPSKNTNSY